MRRIIYRVLKSILYFSVIAFNGNILPSIKVYHFLFIGGYLRKNKVNWYQIQVNSDWLFTQGF